VRDDPRREPRIADAQLSPGPVMPAADTGHDLAYSSARHASARRGRPVTDRSGQVEAGHTTNVWDRVAAATDLAGHAQNPAAGHEHGHRATKGHVAAAVMTGHPGCSGGTGRPVTVTVARRTEVAIK
jgi:hypothetical protein